MAKPASSAEVRKLAEILAEQERWPGMPVADHDRIGSYIRTLADKIGLSEWTFELSHEPLGTDEDTDTYAHIVCTEAQCRAVITLGRGFLDEPLRQKRHTLIHELLHCHHAHATDVMRLTLPKLLGQPTYDALWEPFRQQFELMTDNLAFVLARLTDDSDDLHKLCRGGTLPKEAAP